MTTESPAPRPAAPPAFTVPPQSPPSIWTGQFLLALTIGLAFGIAFNGTVPVLPLYLASLGAAPGEVGVVVGAYGLAALVLRPLTGRFTDQFGPRTVCLAGAVLFLVATPLIAFTTSTPLLVGLRVIQSAGLVSFFTASTALSMATVDPRRTGAAVGVMGLTGGLGGLIASPFAVQIAGTLGWTATFGLLAGLAALSAALCLRVRLPRRETVQATARRLPLVNRRAAAPALIFLGFTLTQGPILAFVPLLAAERGLGNPGLFLAAIGLGNMLARPPGGWAADRFGRPAVVLPGLLLTGAAMLGIALATSTGWFWLAGGVYGIANGMIFTGMMALTLDRVPVEQRGSAIATFQWSWDIGSSVSAAAMGQLVGLLGYPGVFAAAAAFPMLGAAAFVWAVLRRGMGQPPAAPAQAGRV